MKHSSSLSSLLLASSLLVLMAVFAIAATTVRCAEEEQQEESSSSSQSQILTLTDKTFKRQTYSRGLVFVLFTTSWCEQCKAVEAALIEAGEILEKESIKSLVTVAKIDAEAEPKSAKHFKVTDFPTLKLFRLGAEVPEAYTGERTAAAFAAYLKRKATEEDFLQDNSKIYRYTRRTAGIFANSSFSVIRFIIRDPKVPPKPIEKIFAAVLKSDLPGLRFAVAKWDDFENEAIRECSEKAKEYKCCVVGQFSKKSTGGKHVTHSLKAHPFTPQAFDKFLDKFMQKLG